MGEYEFKTFRARFVSRKALRKQTGRDSKGALGVQSFTVERESLEEGDGQEEIAFLHFFKSDFLQRPHSLPTYLLSITGITGHVV